MESCGDIHRLPEDCIANMLSLTSPVDACRLSAVSPTFSSAAQSDAVWERFLPSDYRQIIARSIEGSDSLMNKFGSRKDLYLYLCDSPILIDGGLKSFWLEKRSGKKCYMLAARDLYIVWSDTFQYWQWISLFESRFPEAAELLRVCWLEIKGKININMLSSSTIYAAYLVYTTKVSFYGFELHPAEVSLCMSGQEGITNYVSLVPLDGGNPPADQPRQRDDGWMEVEFGEFSVIGGEDGDLEMSLMDVEGRNWKRGIVVQGIEVRPKDLY